MEAFSLLKYWRASAGAGVSAVDSTASTRLTTKNVVAASAAVSPCSSDGEEGPYFDLEFALPDQESEQSAEKEEQTASESEDDEISVHDDEDDEDGDLKFAVTGDVCTDQNAVAISPSDELFFKGNLIPIENSSILLNDNGSEENSKFPVFLLKSATKFRVLLLKLKKSKSEKSEAGDKDNHGKVAGKLFAVKFKVEEVPVLSLFTRDTSSKGTKQNADVSEANAAASDEKKLTKEVVQKYLKMVKPLYVRVSKLKFSGHITFPTGGSNSCTAGIAPPSPAADMGEKSIPPEPKILLKPVGNINIQAGLKVVRNHLGKSRSASSTVATSVPGTTTTNNRRDDSLLQLQDGIQGAILHCKKSFNASRDCESSSSSMLSRSVSDPTHEKVVMIPIISSASTESSYYTRESKEAKAGSSC